MARKKNKLDLKAKLKYYIDSLTKAVKVDKIILFGSYANGKANKYSDIDIALVSPELNPEEPWLKHVREIKDKVELYDPYLELFTFPTKTFEKELGFDKYFIREIKKTGKVIYQRPS